MGNLFDTAPTHIQQLHSPGVGEEWAVYYRVPAGNLEALGSGRRFAVVRSPSLYRHGSHWSLTQFEVREVYWADKEKPDRSYIQKATRQLTAAEITHMETLILERKELINATLELSKEAAPGAAEQTGESCPEAGEAAGFAPDDGASVAHQLEAESERPFRLQEPEMETTR